MNPLLTRVSLVKGETRRDVIRRSLELIGDDIEHRLWSRQPVIKPNFVSSTVQLASSHVDQIRGILDFFTRIYHGTVIVAEASCSDTREAYQNFGYLDLPGEYPVELVDLNDGPFETITVPGGDGGRLTLKAARMLLDSTKYVVSAAKMKTHDTVIVSMSIKNLAMGSIYRGNRKSVHRGFRETNRFIAEIAERVWPDLAVIDGMEAMEGDGPSRGEAVPLGIAISGTDALAADRVACEVMGVDMHDVGYLHFCSERGMGESDPGRIEVVGERISDCRRPFRLHRSVREQYAWKE